MFTRARGGGVLCLVVAAMSVGASAQAAVLFDGAPNTTPGAQGWIYLSNPFFGAASTQTAAGGFTTLDTTPDAGASDRMEQAGYFSDFPPFTGHPGVGVLDRAVGFTLSVELRVAVENHNVRDDNGDGIDDRAGFSIIVVTQDLRAIEIGFWANEVWAYDDASVSAGDLFTHAEGAAFNTAASIRRFDLLIQGSGYSMSVEGSPLLSGALRDYTPFAGAPDVYEIPSFIFLGDDTTSAESRVEIRRIELNEIPEPGAIALALIGVGVAASRGRERRKRQRETPSP